MKSFFVASAYVDGSQGGTVYLTENCFVFCSNKISIAEEYKKLVIPYDIINSCQIVARIVFIWKIAIMTIDNREYKFLVFSKKKFVDMLNEHDIRIYYEKDSSLF